MKSDTPTENIIKNLTYEEIIYQAQHAPQVFTRASAAEGDGVSRDPGLLLTKEQIINIKIYEATALALPHTLDDVQAYLKFGDANDSGQGLEYTDFLKTFTLTRDHALRWSPLNDAIKLTGTKLQIFSNSMITYGDSIISLCDGIKTLKELDTYLEINKVKTLAQLKEIALSSGNSFPGIELQDDIKKDLGAYLSQIADDVSDNLKESYDLHKKITAFSDDLTNYVLPKIKTQLKLVNSNTVQSDIEELQNSIDERSLSIEEKNKEYKALVQKSFGAAGTMNAVGLGMAIYFGVEAEQLKAERNKLIDEQKLAIESLNKKNQTLASLQRVKLELQELEHITFNADAATKNLRHVWGVIHEYVKKSKESTDEIEDTLSLRLFVTQFKLVVDPWREIKRHTDIFINIFKEADDEYKRIYINSTK